MSNTRKIIEMHQRFGRRGYGQCKDCPHYRRYKYRDKPYRKCAVYGVTNSEATDWTGSWNACGLFDKEYSGPEIVGLLCRKAAERVELDGQIDLFGGNA